MSPARPLHRRNGDATRLHDHSVLHGLSGRAIGGVTYGSAMPAFADQLSDEEVAAVLSYERTAGEAGRGRRPPKVI